jgi:hypothetical protein
MPNRDAEWASNDINETIDINNDGVDEVLENKNEPPEQFKDSGVLWNQPLPSDYLNYQLNLLYLWQTHLNERYSVGDIKLTKSSESVSTISQRLGGTWVSHGTDTIAGQTVNVFEKTA